MASMNENERFVQAYEEYADAIFRYCFYRVYDRERALELVQESFMKTWEYLASGKQIDNIKPFLYKVATNLIIDQSRRRHSPETSLEELQDLGFDPPDPHAVQVEKLVDAKFAAEKLKNLPDMYREAVTLRYINDLSPKEIAEIIGESENVVSVRINRGINQLRKMLNL